mmetsp:Transcript_28893/g.87414  ORF Transcript_28893/g.87414 Transcript_28893/m.87414 type:complete len:403 (-) Transcript_28893:68-1276(-)
MPEQAALRQDRHDVRENVAERAPDGGNTQGELKVLAIHFMRDQHEGLDIHEAAQEAHKQGWRKEPPPADPQHGTSDEKTHHQKLQRGPGPEGGHAQHDEPSQRAGNEPAHLTREIRPHVPPVARRGVGGGEAHAPPHTCLNRILRGIHQKQGHHEFPQRQREPQAPPASQRGRHWHLVALIGGNRAGLAVARARVGREGLDPVSAGAALFRRGALLTASDPRLVDPRLAEHEVVDQQPRDRDPKPQHQLDLEARADELREHDRPEVPEHASQACAAGPTSQAHLRVVERCHRQQARLTKAGLQRRARYAQQLDRPTLAPRHDAEAEYHQHRRRPDADAVRDAVEPIWPSEFDDKGRQIARHVYHADGRIVNLAGPRVHDHAEGVIKEAEAEEGRHAPCHLAA